MKKSRFTETQIVSILKQADAGVAAGEDQAIVRTQQERLRRGPAYYVHLDEETLNGLLCAEADRACGASRYERSE